MRLAPFFYFFLFLHISVFAQSYQDLMKQGKSAGLSESDIQTIGLAQGFSMDQIENYREEQGKQDLINSRERVIESVVPAAVVEPPIENFPIFGLDFFKNAQNGFQPNPNQATPSNYRLGAGDELYVDIYGASEKYYNATISPDGYLTLSNIGPIYLQGKDIEEAEKIITNRLSKVYTGVSGPNPNTFVQVGIGQVRTIQVHLVGEVSSPGTYQLSGLGNVFNALYAAGGPNENGSFRAIKVFRSNKLIGTLDIYQFLIFGKFSSNLRLEDNDVILVPPYLSRVLVKGEVKKPAYFEVLEGQTFLDLLTYAGSFTDEAYEERVELIRSTDKELLVSEVFASQFSFFPVKGGDQYSVGKVLTRYTNRIAISGAVFRPGNYGYTEGITLTQLIDRAEGLRGDAHTERVLINRTAADLSTSTLSINLSEVREGILDDIELQPEDQVIIQSYYDQLQKPFVKISGEVLNAGTFPYKEQITLGDLLFEAKGMKISADQGQVEISRRLSQQTPLSQREVLAIDMNDPDALNFELNAYDHVMIRRNTDYFEEATISVVGEVSTPGIYSLLSREERVSDVLLRAGGLSTWAYPEGATLIRKSEYFEAENEWVNKIIELRAIQNKLDTVYSEAGQVLNQKINEEITQY
ncbi:MAG: protein involved in polysaccharide export with SLBB domain, partial [Parvicella sp.]